jgi:hypothetical protein
MRLAPRYLPSELITFDENQVAAYTVGTQTVLVPYANLNAIIDPAGPLTEFVD